MSVAEDRMRKLLRAAPTSADHLLDLLLNGLDWPIPDGMSWDELELAWEPEELHLDPEKVANLKRISQIPPLTKNQGFGTFVLDFEGGRLPIGAIRRLVHRLVKNERARTGSGTHAQWSLNDLLFFCLSDGHEKLLHVVNFRERDGKRVLRVMSWSDELTSTRLDLLVRRGVPDLVWSPGSGPRIILSPDSGDGFHGYREGIRSAAALSRRMAEVAQDVRDEVRALYEVETEDGPIRALFQDVRTQLLGDLTPKRFADVYAQTMVYGLLTARIAHPDQFKVEQSVSTLRFDNDFLDAIYSRFRDDSDGIIDVDELGLNELAEELARTDVDELLADFGADNQRDDPVVYFYEEFLAQYDPEQRRNLGAYYTPLPVVRFMIRAVDTALKMSVGLQRGIADQSTWQDLCWDAPPLARPSDPILNALDPANGTGTFLVQWLKAARGVGRSAEDVLDRYTAFEVSLASYAVSQLKIQLEVGVSDVSVPVFLTDTLEGPSQVLEIFDDPISLEGHRANERKFERNHTVIIGNPPYDRDESQTKSTVRRKGGLVRYHGLTNDYGLIRDFIAPLKRDGMGVYAKSLYNDYVYFWRWAIWKACEQSPGPAVIALISPSSFLAGPAFAGMREFMRKTFDELWLVDLGGEGRGVHREDNVFDGVLTPVVIGVGVRYRTRGPQRTQIRYRRIRGDRATKFQLLDNLAGLDQADPSWLTIEGGCASSFLPAADTSFDSLPLLTDLFPWRETGLHFYRTWPIAESADDLVRRWSALMAAEPAGRGALLKESRDRKASKPYKDVLTGTPLAPIEALPATSPVPTIRRYAYRSFDREWCMPDGRLGDYLRPQLWGCSSDQQIYFQTLVMSPLGAGPALMAFADVPDCHAFRGRGDKGVMPLWRDAARTSSNVASGVLELLRKELRAGIEPEDVAAYVYGILGTGAYSDRFAKEVAALTTGPRIPITKDVGCFDETVALGRDLIGWHTFGERGRQDELVISTREVRRISGRPTTFGYDSKTSELLVGNGAIAPVSQDVYDFEVSGLRVLQSWLGNRMAGGKGRKSSPLDDIRYVEWVFTDELLAVISILQNTIDVTPVARDLLDRILDGPVFSPRDFPPPTDAERMAPKY